MSYFNSPIAYIFIACFWLPATGFFPEFFHLSASVDARIFCAAALDLLFLAPAVTMRLWSEEKKSGTIEFLLTLPITTWQAVLAKFFGALVFMIISLVLTSAFPWRFLIWVIWILVHWLAVIWVQYFWPERICRSGFLCLTDAQSDYRFRARLVVCFAAFIIGSGFVLIAAPVAIAPLLSFLALGTHFDSIARGVIDSKDVVYYLSFIFLFLWLNTQVIGRELGSKIKLLHC